MNGHLKIKKVYKDERPDEVVVDDANTLSDGFYRTLINVFRNDGSDDIEDIRANYFQVGSGEVLDSFAVKYIRKDYTPDSVTGNTWEKLTIWLPEGTAPSEGWPVYINTQYGTWRSKLANHGVTLTASNSYVPYWCLKNGIAVVDLGLTGSDYGLDTYPGAIPWDDWETSGCGAFAPPSDTVSNKWTRDDVRFGAKDLMWAIQYLRLNSDTYNINPNLFVGEGHSAGAQTMMWVGTQEFASGTASDPQLRESTLLQGMYLKNGMFWFPVFHEDYDTCASAFPASSTWNNTYNLESSTAPTMKDTWSGQTADSDKPTVNYLEEASTFKTAFDTTTKQDRMKTVPICLHYFGTGSDIVDTNISLDSNTPPLPTLSNESGLLAHSSWSGYAMHQRLRDLNLSFHGVSSLLMCDENASSTGDPNFTPHSINYLSSLDASTTYESSTIAWLTDIYNIDTSKPISNFFELGEPLLSNELYGLATNGGVETLDQITADLGVFTTSSMPFAKMMPDNITKITPNGAHHRIEIDLAMANGQTISEVGLFAKNPEGQPNDRPLMMAYKTFTPITKESDFSFVFDWTIYL